MKREYETNQTVQNAIIDKPFCRWCGRLRNVFPSYTSIVNNHCLHTDLIVQRWANITD